MDEKRGSGIFAAPEVFCNAKRAREPSTGSFFVA